MYQNDAWTLSDNSYTIRIPNTGFLCLSSALTVDQVGVPDVGWSFLGVLVIGNLAVHFGSMLHAGVPGLWRLLKTQIRGSHGGNPSRRPHRKHTGGQQHMSVGPYSLFYTPVPWIHGRGPVAFAALFGVLTCFRHSTVTL